MPPSATNGEGAAEFDERFFPTMTLAELAAEASEKPRLIVQDVRVAGTVSSSDAAGNFYQSLVFEDVTGAAELFAGLYDLHRDYPPGTRIAVRLRGLGIARRRGVLQIGRMPLTGDFAVEPLASGAIDVVAQYVQRGFWENTPSASSRLIKTLTPADCGRLVRVGALRLVEPEIADRTSETGKDAASEAGTRAMGDTGQGRAWSGYRVFEDADGAKIRSYTSDYADFASQEIPLGPVALTGILQVEPAGEATYTIKLRDAADCEEQ